MNATKKAVIAAAAIAALAVCADDQGKEVKRDLLSKHETVARFEGVEYHRCFGLTSRCPDQCGESGTTAVFRVCTYISYEKPGEYGDPKQEQYVFLVEDNMGNPKVAKEIAGKVHALKAGNYVLLSWRHDYVTREYSGGGSSKSPDRVVTKLAPITREEAAKKAGDLKKFEQVSTNAAPIKMAPMSMAL